MNAPARIAVDTNKLNAALGRFPRDRAMIIDGREVKGRGETIERSSPAHGVVVTRVPRGSAEDARTAIAAARIAFDKGSWLRQTASNRARVLLKTADLIDRDRESLRPRCRRSHIRQPGASGRACERHRLRPLRQCLEPGRRHSDWRRPRGPRGYDLGQHLHGRNPGASVRWIPPVGHWPRARVQRGQGLHRGEDVPRPYRTSDELVAPARSVGPKQSGAETGFPNSAAGPFPAEEG